MEQYIVYRAAKTITRSALGGLLLLHSQFPAFYPLDKTSCGAHKEVRAWATETVSGRES